MISLSSRCPCMDIICEKHSLCSTWSLSPPTWPASIHQPAHVHPKQIQSDIKILRISTFFSFFWAWSRPTGPIEPLSVFRSPSECSYRWSPSAKHGSEKIQAASFSPRCPATQLWRFVDSILGWSWPEFPSLFVHMKSPKGTNLSD